MLTQAQLCAHVSQKVRLVENAMPTSSNILQRVLYIDEKGFFRASGSTESGEGSVGFSPLCNATCSSVSMGEGGVRRTGRLKECGSDLLLFRCCDLLSLAGGGIGGVRNSALRGCWAVSFLNKAVEGLMDGLEFSLKPVLELAR